MNDDSPSQDQKQRRSERLFLTLPIRVSGTDPKGRDFTEDCVSINVSKHGARIRLKNSLTVDDVVHIKNLKNDQEANFRVVGRVGQPDPSQPYADWGVETLAPEKNIWGVELRENPTEETAFSALLQCTNCTIMSSFLLTYREVGATGASAFITRHCPRCGRETAWSFVSSDRREQMVAPEKPGAEAEATEGKRRGRRPDRRSERRLTIQVPIRVRTPEGQMEVSTTIDLSRRGARFFGVHDYAVGALLYVTVPYKAGEEPIEIKASVEHVEEVGEAPASGEEKRGSVRHVDPLPGSPKKLYGIKFELKNMLI